MKPTRWAFLALLLAGAACAAVAPAPRGKAAPDKKATPAKKTPATKPPAGAKKPVAAKPAPKKPPARKPPAKKPPAKQVTGITIDPSGLRKDSSRLFAIYRGQQCLKYNAIIGQKIPLAPGEYDVKVGFLSGWVTHKATVKPGQLTVIPTGLFQFRSLTPPDLPSAIPQKLYHGDTYLVTGYQGQTARLLPGTYTVRHRAPADETPAEVLRSWRAVGPFRSKYVRGRELANVFPPEQTPVPDFSKAYTVNKTPYAWKQVGGRPEGNVWDGSKGSGVFYLATEIDSGAERGVQLTFMPRGGAKVWLNGKVIKTVPPLSNYRQRRIEVFPTLRKGKNVLFIKTFASQYGAWPLRVLVERWHTYQVTVATGPGRPKATPSQPTATSRPPLPPPVKGIKGIVFCQAPNLPNGRSGLHYELFRIVRRPPKARISTLIPAAPNGKLADLTSKHFASAIYPDLSYDGKKIIFSGKKTTQRDDKWQVWEMNLDGSGLRQVTKEPGDCYDPYYLPSGKILFSCTKVGFRDEYDRDVPPILHTCNADGSDVQQISFNLSSDTASVMLDDGRVLFTSWQHHGDHQGVAGNFALCTIMADGTGFNLFCGNRNLMSKTKSFSQQLLDGRVIVVETGGHRHYNAGYLTSVHPRKPLKTRKFLTPEVELNGANLGGRFASPYPLPDGGMLVSYSPGRGTALLYEQPSEEIHLGVYRFDFASGRAGRLIFDDPNAQDFDAIAIYSRPVPPDVPSMVVPGKKTGVMCCVNAYLSDRPKQTKRVVVGELPPADPGRIKAVRVVEGFGVHDTDRSKHRSTVIDMLQMSFGSNSNGGSNFEQKRIIGYAPAEPDGSFNIEVPADTVISLQTLDSDGMAIETQLTWTWVRPGETRMCVGCHEDREQALPNLDCLAMRKPPHKVIAPPDRRRTLDFRRDIMPIIEKNCSMPACHGAETKAGGLDLRKGFELVFHRTGCRGRKINAAFFNQAYESLLQAPPSRIGTLVVPCAARHSPLIWRLYGKKLGWSDQRNPYKKAIRPMPPGKPLSDADKKRFVEWVDLGAQWDNIVAEDDLPGYDAAASAKMAKAANAMLSQPILDPEKAFTVRCFECHDYRRNDMMKKKRPDEIPATVQRMVAKRKGWVKEPEIPLIVQYIQKTYCKAPTPKKPAPAKKPAPTKKRAPAKKPPPKKA